MVWLFGSGAMTQLTISWYGKSSWRVSFPNNFKSSPVRFMVHGLVKISASHPYPKSTMSASALASGTIGGSTMLSEV
jgi:hypothetical protein